MRKIFLTGVMLLAVSWVFAQNGATPAMNDGSSPGSQPVQQPDQSNTPNAEEATQTLEGCLGGAANSYTLTVASGQHYLLKGSASTLSRNVGHQVRIWGVEGTTGGGATISASGPQSTFSVKKLQTLSTRCPHK